MLSELGLGAPRVLPSERTRKQRGKALEKKKKKQQRKKDVQYGVNQCLLACVNCLTGLSRSCICIDAWRAREAWPVSAGQDVRRKKMPVAKMLTCHIPGGAVRPLGLEEPSRQRWDQRVRESGPGWASSATGKTLALRCELGHETLNRRLCRSRKTS